MPITTSVNSASTYWNSDLVEHLIAAPDEGSDLFDAEVERMATRILEQVSPRSPAIWAAHFDEITKTWEIHFAISSFTDEVTPGLRVTDLRRREAADYGLLIDEAGFIALHEINFLRLRENRPTIRSLADIQETKLDSVMEVFVRHEELRQLSKMSDDSVLALLEGSHWEVKKKTPKSIKLASAQFKTPLVIRWADFRRYIKRKAKQLDRTLDGRSDSIEPDSEYERD